MAAGRDLAHAGSVSPIPHRGARAASLGLAVAVVLTVLGASVATATEFPAGRQGYHSYTELTTEVAAVAAAHPDIVERFSIGKSYQGRQHVGGQDLRQRHGRRERARGHVRRTAPLRRAHGRRDDAPHPPLARRRVRHRPADHEDREHPRDLDRVLVNPDGAEYDISGGNFHHWRKNRQPTPGSTSIGTDLNRNYSYRWGGGGTDTSANPQAITYRGPKAFSTPETGAMRDFMASRVVDGRQQIRAAITFHEYGRLVMWPYGYT